MMKACSSRVYHIVDLGLFQRITGRQKESADLQKDESGLTYAFKDTEQCPNNHKSSEIVASGSTGQDGTPCSDTIQS